MGFAALKPSTCRNEQGGSTASVSYSPYLGTAIKRLYAEAIAGYGLLPLTA